MALSNDLIYFWLGLSRITSRRVNSLFERYSPFELWEGIGKTITNQNLFGEKAYEALLRYRSEEFLTQSISRLDDVGISFITLNKFPERLRQKEVDPPVMLYYRGNIKLLESNCVSVVGTRACSIYGKEAATRLVTDLCESGITIVSGLASGIDTYAHRAALRAGGNTVAVLGSGINNITPASNITLAEEIVKSGGLMLSEYPPRAEATKFTFPERNRIISGLSAGVIVVEAGLKSGALITADFALEQNRTVFAVPGNITSAKSAGSNRLLYEGAVPALCAEDICNTLDFEFGKNVKKPSAIQLDIFEQKIYNILLPGDESFDSLVEKTEIAPSKLSALLSGMEIKGFIKKKQSNIYSAQ